MLMACQTDRLAKTIFERHLHNNTPSSIRKRLRDQSCAGHVHIPYDICNKSNAINRHRAGSERINQPWERVWAL